MPRLAHYLSNPPLFKSSVMKIYVYLFIYIYIYIHVGMYIHNKSMKEAIKIHRINFKLIT